MKGSDKEWYENAAGAPLDPQTPCPFCQAKGYLRLFGHYRRYLAKWDAMPKRAVPSLSPDIFVTSAGIRIGVFTARPGMGKTYALRCFMNGLNPNQYQTAYINLSTISVSEFYRQFCDLLGVEAGGNKTQMFKGIQERVYYLYKEKKQPLVLAIDEAQYLSYNILRDLKMLMNYRYDSLNCFRLVLVGEPYLNHILEEQVHEALRQRITVHYDYEGLSDKEVPEYIRHKHIVIDRPWFLL